jgi:hypothetical protein
MNLTRIHRRIAQRRREGVLRVIRYVTDLPPEVRAVVLPDLPEQEAAAVVARVRGSEWKRAVAAERAARVHAARVASQAAAQLKAREELDRTLAAARLACGSAARAAAASRYTQAELKPLLSPPERQQLSALRAEEITRAHVCRLLGCTATEFNRWCASRRLPVFRTKQLASQKAARTFLRSEVAPLRAHVSGWREQDAIRKVSRRRGLRCV